jgi:hypothetical protein
MAQLYKGNRHSPSRPFTKIGPLSTRLTTILAIDEVAYTTIFEKQN